MLETGRWEMGDANISFYKRRKLGMVGING